MHEYYLGILINPRLGQIQFYAIEYDPEAPQSDPITSVFANEPQEWFDYINESGMNLEEDTVVEDYLSSFEAEVFPISERLFNIAEKQSNIITLKILLPDPFIDF